MTEPSTAPPEQVQQVTPQPGQQAPVQPVVISTAPPPAAPAGEPPVAPSPELAQLQQQNAQYQQAMAQQQEQYRQLQGEFTRKSQALAQLAGAQPTAPPQDPIAPLVNRMANEFGMHPDDARKFAPAMNALIQDAMRPMQQQLQQSHAQLQGGLHVDQVLNQVYSANPQLFANQGIYDATRQALVAQIMANGQVDAEQAEYTAVVMAHQAAKRGQQAPMQPQFQPQQQPIAQPFQNGMFRVMPNFQTQQAAGPAALPADAAFVDAEMRARFNLPPKTA